MRSKFLLLNLRDFLKGLLYALASGIITFLHEWILTGQPLDITVLKPMGLVALSTLLAYLSANLFQNSEGKFLKLEPKK